MIDLFTISDFLDATTRGEIALEMRRASGNLAAVYGGKAAAGAVELNVRKVNRIAVSPQTREAVMRQLQGRKPEIEQHFGVTLGDCEEPQFLRYQTGDFFVAHQDGNTPLVYDHTRFRKISVVIFLSRQSTELLPDTFGGGTLMFHGSGSNFNLRTPALAEPGTLVAFRAETTHEVVPVTHGERYTIVSWYRSP